MHLTVELDKPTQKALDDLKRKTGLSKSQLGKRAIQLFLEQRKEIKLIGGT